MALDERAETSALPAERRGQRPIRFGIMARSTTLRRWQADVVLRLMDLDDVRPALLVIDARPPPPRGAKDRVERLVRSPTALWDAYNNGWVARRSAALRPVDLADVLGALPRVDVLVDKQGFSERFPAGAVDEIRAHDLDFILRFGFGIIRGPVLESARHGVWSFHHDDDDAYRGSPPAFWEIVDGVPVTGAILQQLTDRLDGGVVLEKGWFPTTAHSYVRNTDAVHLGGADWPARAVERLRVEGDLSFGHPSRSVAPISKAPSNRRAASFLLGQGARFLRSQVGSLTYADQWEVGVVHDPIHRFLDPTYVPQVQWQGLGQPGTAYAADPFVVEVDGAPHVLYERYDAARRHGEIWEARLGDPSTARPAGLPVDAHASYPYVFTHEGETYCLPQVSADGVPLFRRADDGWVHHGDLLPGGQVLDPTIVVHESRLWLFGTRPGRDSLTKLHLWSADRLEGPWRAHPANPVKTDVRSARPAGTPFVHEGRLIRPAQDCAGGYGAAVALCEVTVLDEHRFAEEVVRVVTPSPSWPFARGIHTLAAHGNLTVLDARTRVFDRHETMAELRGRVSRRSHR